jgi:hypothetical protein
VHPGFVLIGIRGEGRGVHDPRLRRLLLIGRRHQDKCRFAVDVEMDGVDAETLGERGAVVFFGRPAGRRQR